MINLLASTLLCTGAAPTTPATNVEIEVRPGKFSTIRYEYAEGPYAGTAYIQSLGHLDGSVHGQYAYFRSGQEPTMTKLLLKFGGDQILEAHFSHPSSGMNNCPLECTIEEE